MNQSSEADKTPKKSCYGCKQINVEEKWCSACHLKHREHKYGTCTECKQINTGHKWCQNCNSKRFQQNFDKWTSDNDDVDKFIQDTQLSAKKDYQLLEWVPYDRFCEVIYIAEGGFGKVFRSRWKDGCIAHWDITKHQWKRNIRNKWVALKSLNNSQKVTSKFINEITSHLRIFENKMIDNIMKCYGITQDPNTKEYIMVMHYADRGSLRTFLKNPHKRKLRKILENNVVQWKYKLKILQDIAAGLKKMHWIGLLHRDLHIGNIVCNKGVTYITDMGLCKPANYNELGNTEDNIYGVLPNIAPEVLRRQQNYTPASDIYSFGIIMYEVISEKPPYHEFAHDDNLALKICKGLRPRFNIEVPRLILHLIKRCLDADSSSRPNAKELSRIICEWTLDLSKYLNDINDQSELIKQIEETERVNNRSSASSTYKIHSEATYTSSLLKFNNLPEPKNSDDYYENYGNISSMEYSDCLDCEVTD